VKLPPLPATTRIRGNQYRIISTCYPPIDFFEQHVLPELLGPLWELEAETNPRLMMEAGDIGLIPNDDWVTGPGASIVMAAFTHINHATRFSDGNFGVYYASRKFETAIRETVHHREIIAADAQLGPDQFDMRAWIGQIKKPLHDIRAPRYKDLHDPAPRPEDHPLAQAFGKMLKQQDSWGLIYNSVRNPGGECIAALCPPAVSLPTQGAHLVYVWNGEKITEVFERSAPIISFD
jgi:hypothetical protein